MAVCYNKNYMDSFNKVISFVLGLVVVVVFLAVITGRINLRNLSNITRRPTATSTPAKTPTGGPTATPFSTATPKAPVETTAPTAANRFQAAPGTIPSTGLPTATVPLLLSSLMGGFFLRRKK
jgi:hypothetical protein